MCADVCRRIIGWFEEGYREWLDGSRLLSRAQKLGIKLERNGVLDEGQLFHLFVLAVLWNSKPTYRAEIGVSVFSRY